MSDVVLDSFLTTIAAAPATADDQVSENQSTAEEKTSKRKPALPASWHPFTYDELRRELGTIKDMPEKALDAITTAAFLCATMPGPVRDAWRIARKPFDRLLAALLETGYAPDWKQTLWEMRSRFERDRQFELREASRPPIAALISGDPDDDLENLEFAEPVESDSVEVGMERVRTGRKKWKHFTDFVVIVVRVLEEAGCPEASEDRRDEALKAGKAFVRSSFDIVFDVVDLAWASRRRPTTHAR